MYTFKDKGDRSITLKPEGTAGVARCLLENNLYADTLPCKMYYLNAPIFRYEAPQSGRLREHHQFGLECFGARDASADAELILLAYRERTGREEPVRQHQLHRLPELPPEVPCNAQIVPVRAHWRNVQHLPDTL